MSLSDVALIVSIANGSVIFVSRIWRLLQRHMRTGNPKRHPQRRYS